jgi:hypothetical protein
MLALVGRKRRPVYPKGASDLGSFKVASFDFTVDRYRVNL